MNNTIINPFTKEINKIKRKDELDRKATIKKFESEKLDINNQAVEKFKKDFSRYYSVMVDSGITIEPSKMEYKCIVLSCNDRKLLLYHYNYGRNIENRWGTQYQAMASIDTTIKDIVLLIHKKLFELDA